LVEAQRLDDPLAELGLGTQQRRYLTLSGGASSTWSRAVGAHRATAGLELRGDRFRDAPVDGARPALVGDRGGVAGGLGAELAFADGVVVVTPALRVDAVRTAPTPVTAGPTAYQPVPPRWDVVPSPRLTARVTLDDDVALKGSAGWYVRLPTLLELFGDRGFILGSPELRAERGPSAELGVVWAPARALCGGLPIDRVLVEVDAFATRARDTIALVSSAGFVARALNVGDTQTVGGEVAASARVARAVAITANYTLLATEQRTAEPSFAGKELPRQPRHALYARVDASQRVAGRLAGLWLDASWQATSYLDQANLQAVPARLLVGVGARVELGGGLALALDVGNLADTRVERLPLDPAPRPDLASVPTALADLAGYPLPGRTYYLSLDWTH
jgi:iron complex outermembrane receptor protein